MHEINLSYFFLVFLSLPLLPFLVEPLLLFPLSGIIHTSLNISITFSNIFYISIKIPSILIGDGSTFFIVILWKNIEPSPTFFILACPFS
jgi:hypothetical protein